MVESAIDRAFRAVKIIGHNVYLQRPERVLAEDDLPICKCAVSERDEAGCLDDGCTNRSARYECIRGYCPCDIKCANQRFQSGSVVPIAVVDCGRKGVGVLTLDRLRSLAIIAQTATQLPPHAFPLRIVANFKGALNNLSRSDVANVLGLPDNRFGRMAPYLDLVPGMPVQVTQNVGTAKGVANGTLGTLESVHFPSQPPTTFRLVRDGATVLFAAASEPRDVASRATASRNSAAEWSRRGAGHSGGRLSRVTRRNTWKR